MSTGAEIIRGAIEGAKDGKRSDARAAGRGKRKTQTPHKMDFPEDCPVEPLGQNGDYIYFLDEKRQLRSIKSKDLNHSTISDLFIEQPELMYTYWPKGRTDDEGNFTLTGFNPVQARDVLRKEAGRRGLIDIMEAVRGSGCWRDEQGNLIMHCGNVIYAGGEAVTPRQIGRHVYPAEPPRPGPALALDGKAEAAELLALLQTWNWKRPEVDPALLLGWIGCAIAGGALRWRPMVWVTGDKATGKSTLHEVLKEVFGPGGIISSSDTTAAGLWQSVGHSTRPVAVDELEAEYDGRKAQGIIKLARTASSAGQTLRGGSDHNSASFTVRSCFLFSSILIPPMLGQDVSRMAVLALDALPESVKPPALEPERLLRIGAGLRNRIIKQWPRFAELLHTWQSTLATVGHGGRSGDQFGTLIAMQDLLLHDAAPDSDTLDYWAGHLRKSAMSENEGDVANHERCVRHLWTSMLDLYRSGEKRTVGTWIMMAAGKGTAEIKEQDEARRALANIGVLVQEKFAGGKPFHVIQIANDHQGLAAIYEGTDWAGRPGADGVWVQAFRRLKGAIADRQRFGGLRLSSTAVLLENLTGEDNYA